jgi:hypothetical protein
MVHHNEIVISKKDLEKSRALKHIVSRVSENFTIIDDFDNIILRKTGRLDARIRFSKKAK